MCSTQAALKSRRLVNRGEWCDKSQFFWPPGHFFADGNLDKTNQDQTKTAASVCRRDWRPVAATRRAPARTLQPRHVADYGATVSYEAHRRIACRSRWLRICERQQATATPGPCAHQRRVCRKPQQYIRGIVFATIAKDIWWEDAEVAFWRSAASCVEHTVAPGNSVRWVRRGCSFDGLRETRLRSRVEEHNALGA